MRHFAWILLPLLFVACSAHDIAQTGELCGGKDNIPCDVGLLCTANVAEEEGICVRSAAPARSLRMFTDALDERMMEQDIINIFGQPDKDIGSGIHIYMYVLDDGSQVWIGLAGRILYARNVNADGSLIEVLMDGQIISNFSSEPVSFELPERTQVRKRLRPATTEAVFLSEVCGKSQYDITGMFGKSQQPLYAILDRDDNAMYVLSVLPNVRNYADRNDVLRDLGECSSDAPSLIALNERWLVFGVRTSDVAEAREVEQDILSSIRPL